MPTIRTAHKFTDDGLASDFATNHPNLRYTATWGKWHEWDGERWREDRTVNVFEHVRTYVRSLRAPKNVAQSLRSSGTISAIERLARSDRNFAMVPEQWDADDWVLSMPGGIVDLRSGTIRPARKEDYATKITAVAPGGECPLWLAFLDRVTDHDRDLQSFLQRMFGYCLTGSVNEHALFFLYGPGGNGKSTILETSRAILGDYSRSAPSGMCMSTSFDRHPTDVAGLRGTRMAITTEIDEGRAWDTTRIKGLTGGDAISARFMRQDYFDFEPKFKLLISGNDQPRLSRVDEAIRRRFNVLPFQVRITDPDPEFREKLKPEWPGILAWMIQGCLMWQEHGLSAPTRVMSATADYLESQDTIGRWIAEDCELKPGAETPVGELFQAFKQWCSRNDEQECSIKALGTDLQQRGIERGRSGHDKTRVMIGIRLRASAGISVATTGGSGVADGCGRLAL